MNRWSVLDRLKDNWPRQFDQPRIAFLEKETRDIEADVLEAGITNVLRSQEYPPTLAVIRNACLQVSGARGRRPKQKPRPGDTDPKTGERYMTGREAARALHQLCTEHPEILKPKPLYGLDGKEGVEDTVRRIMASAYRRCIKADGGSIPMEYAGQEELSI